MVNKNERGADISGPGYYRMRRRMGASYEALLEDTLRLQREALRDVPHLLTDNVRRQARRDDDYPAPAAARQEPNPRRPGPCLAVHADWALHDWTLRHTPAVRSFDTCTPCTTLELCRQEEHCDRTHNGYR